MMKNLLLLGLLSWVSFVYARPDYSIVRESMMEAQSYKVEKPVQEQEATRAVAGSKIKKSRTGVQQEEHAKEEQPIDSEVRYWQYSE